MKRLYLWHIDAEGYLYQGFGIRHPVAVWKPAERVWAVTNHHDRPLGRGERVSEHEAERCYPGSTTVALPTGLDGSIEVTFDQWANLRPEVFDDYDGPTIRRSPEEDESFRRGLLGEKNEG